MGLVLVTPPASQPVTLATAKLHVRQDLNDDDTLLTALIPAARRYIEEYTRRSLMPATWRLTFTGGFGWDVGDTNLPGCDQPFVLYRAAPLISVTTFVYTDTDGTPTPLVVGTDYRVDADAEPAKLWPAWGESWPDTREGPAAVSVTYQAGYANAEAVPTPLAQALLLLLGHWYVNREAIAAGVVQRIPHGVNELLAPFCVERYL